jgi:hypothetical protein
MNDSPPSLTRLYNGLDRSSVLIHRLMACTADTFESWTIRASIWEERARCCE